MTSPSLSLHLISGSLLLLTLTLSSVAAHAEESPEIERCLQGYAQNCHAFPFATVTCKIVSGMALSNADAIAGKFIVDREKRYPVRITLTWMFNGTNSICIESCDEEDPLRPVPGQPGIAVANCRGMTWLTDGRFQLNGGPKFANIHDNKLDPHPGWGSSNLPFSVTMMGGSNGIPGQEQLSPFVAIQKIREQKRDVHYDGEQPLDGRKVHVVTIGPSKEKPSKQYHFDEQQGFLPVRIRYLKDPSSSPEILGMILSARKCPAGYFPTRIVRIQSSDLPDGQPRGVRTLEVTHLDVTTPPSEKDFSIAFEENALVASGSKPDLAVRIPDKRTVSLSDLETLMNDVNTFHLLPMGK